MKTGEVRSERLRSGAFFCHFSEFEGHIGLKMSLEKSEKFIIHSPTRSQGRSFDRRDDVFEKRVLAGGQAVMYRGNCLGIIPTLPKGSIDAVITDPPYSSGGMMRGDRTGSTRSKYQSSGKLITEHASFSGDNLDQRSYLEWARMWLSLALYVTKPGGVAITFSDWRQLPTATDALQVAGWVWRGIVPWDKINARPMPNRFRAQCEFAPWASNGPRDFTREGATYHPGVLSECPPYNAKRQHSTQKPVGIMETLCKIVVEGETVLDPFSGSGTTGVACLRTGRRFIGMELDPGNFEIACKRIEEK